MKFLATAALSALLLTGVTAATTTPAEARVSVGFYVGDGDYGPPRGYYRRHYDPVYYDGYWYRGPIYYRGYGPRRMYWIDGDWRYDGWRGPRPRHIDWRDRGWRDRDWHDRGWRHRGYRDWR